MNIEVIRSMKDEYYQSFPDNKTNVEKNCRVVNIRLNDKKKTFVMMKIILGHQPLQRKVYLGPSYISNNITKKIE